MIEIPISKFKATCLAVLEQVRVSGQPVRVTRFGKPVADIQPPNTARKPPRTLGSMEGLLGAPDDIVQTPGLWDGDEIVQEWDELNSTRTPTPRRRKRG